jgi:hypothetical protein
MRAKTVGAGSNALSPRSHRLLSAEKRPQPGEVGYGRLVRVQQGRGGDDGSRALERRHNAADEKGFPAISWRFGGPKWAACEMGSRNTNLSFLGNVLAWPRAAGFHPSLGEAACRRA